MNRAGLLQLAVHANALQEAALEFATSAAQQELSAQLLLVSVASRLILDALCSAPLQHHARKVWAVPGNASLLGWLQELSRSEDLVAASIGSQAKGTDGVV